MAQGRSSGRGTTLLGSLINMRSLRLVLVFFLSSTVFVGGSRSKGCRRKGTGVSMSGKGPDGRVVSRRFNISKFLLKGKERTRNVHTLELSNSLSRRTSAHT